MKNELNLTKISKSLSYLLRHSRKMVDPHGWAETARVLEELQKRHKGVDMDVLREIVRTDEKGRYVFGPQELSIRATQGHSVKVDVGFEKKTPPEILYHGTAVRFLPSIMANGLNGQTRLYVQLSKDMDTALSVGKRHGVPVVLTVLTGKMYRDGYEFFLSENGIWQTRVVPPEYLEVDP